MLKIIIESSLVYILSFRCPAISGTPFNTCNTVEHYREVFKLLNSDMNERVRQLAEQTMIAVMPLAPSSLKD
jgi:hypothetical protein